MGVCACTGFAYVEGPLIGYRVATTQYGPVSPRERSGGPRFTLPDSPSILLDRREEYGRLPPEDRSSWSRFDTPGSTIYLADDRRTAYAETLAQFRLSPEHRSAISFVAEFFEMSWEQAREQVGDEMRVNGNTPPWVLPDRWRQDHRLYLLEVQEPLRWIDLTAFETITALQDQLGGVLSIEAEVEWLTLEHIAGGSRDITTYLAEWIRLQVLDDGTFPAGVVAYSKHGGGTCWAYWLRRHDTGDGTDPVEVVDEEKITSTDSDLLEVLDRFGIEPS